LSSKHELCLKAVRARVAHSCAKCGASISKHEVYYREAPREPFLQYLRSRAFCQKCFDRRLRRNYERALRRHPKAFPDGKCLKQAQTIQS